MTTKTDPALYKSDFERNRLDRYWTEHEATRAVADRMPPGLRRAWDPCAGRGDILCVLKEYGRLTYASDIDTSELKLPWFEEYATADFLDDNAVPDFAVYNDIHAIVTNTPFGDTAEKLVRQALTFKNIRYFAFLLRAEWDHASTRRDLFEAEPFAKEIVLTWRLRWDWWLTDEEKRARKIAAGKDPDVQHSPRHNFSWFVWDREHKGPAIKQYAHKRKD